MDDASSMSIRGDLLIDLNENNSLRFFGQFFDVDRNGSAMRGIDDPSPNIRDLSQDFDLSDKPKGVYRIQVSNEKSLKTLNVVIQ